MNGPGVREMLDALVTSLEGELRASAWAALTIHAALASGQDLTDRGAAERRLLELLCALPDPPDESVATRTRVLVVEDSVLIAGAVRRLLGPSYEVVLAADGNAARDLLVSGASFDVILSDVQMPRLDGLGLLRWIRTQCPDVLDHLVFMTADPELPAARLIARTHPVLRKPCTRDMLREALRAARKPAIG